MTDDHGMNTNAASTETPDVQAAPRRLVRPVAGRSIAGVAAGLAEYLGMSVNWVRFGFLVATVFGGLGIVLYLAGWVLIRDENETETIAERVVGNIGSGSSWLGIALVIVGAVIVLDIFTFMPGSLIWALVLVVVGLFLYRGDVGPGERPTDEEVAPTASSATQPPPNRSLPEGTPPPPPAGPAAVYDPPPPSEPPPPPSILGRLVVGVALLSLGLLAVVDNLTTAIDAQPRHYLALATVVLGAGLLVGAFLGRARWTILLGIFLLPALFASPAAEVDWDGSFEWFVAPSELSTLAPSYQATAGTYRFDLTESDWDGETVQLDVDLAVGEVVIVVPEDVGVTGDARVGVGAIDAPDGDRGGVGGITRTFDVPGERGTVVLDVGVGIGAIEIHVGSDTGTSSFGGAETGWIVIDERTR